MDNGKACVRCGETKPLTEFHKRKIAHDGLNPACKDCICAERRAYTKAQPEKLRAYRRSRQLDPEFRAERAEASRQWRAENVEHRAQYARCYDLANADNVAAWKRAWWEANRERLSERLRSEPEVRARRLASWLAYRVRHQEARAERQRRRRVDKLGLTIEDVDLDALWTGSCCLCGRLIDRGLAWPDPMSKSVDHIIPLSRGGTHEARNLAWTHLFCNISKGARMP